VADALAAKLTVAEFVVTLLMANAVGALQGGVWVVSEAAAEAGLVPPPAAAVQVPLTVTE
jgi:hypothetical protein